MAYFKTTVKAGRTIEVTKSFTKRVGAATRGKKEKLTPEEMQKINERNAERKLRLKINANFVPDDIFGTLTYRKENRPSPEMAEKYIDRFIDGLRKAYRKVGEELKWVCVTEYMSKSIHHHILVNHIERYDASKMIRKLWPHGRPGFKYLDDTGQYKDLAAYLIKETSKTCKNNNGARKQRYRCSRNLIMPTPKTEIIKKAARWLPDPKPVKGYYIDKETIYNGVDPFTGREYQRYTMVQIQKCGSG